MNDKPFTFDEECNICYIIGDWYLANKDIYIDWENKTNRLFDACVLLINCIVNDVCKNEEQIDFVKKQIYRWNYEWSDSITDYKGREHRLGYAKEQLKKYLCMPYKISKEMALANAKLDVLFNYFDLGKDR